MKKMPHPHKLRRHNSTKHKHKCRFFSRFPSLLVVLLNVCRIVVYMYNLCRPTTTRGDYYLGHVPPPSILALSRPFIHPSFRPCIKMCQATKTVPRPYTNEA